MGMMQQTLDRLQQEGKLNSSCACRWLTDNIQWDNKWQQELNDTSFVLMKWMGSGLDTLQLLQPGALQVCLILYGDHRYVVQGTGVVLLLALLAADEQRPVLAGEAVLQDAVDEVGLAAVQEAGDEINRNIHVK